MGLWDPQNRDHPQQGLCDEKDFNIEILLPSGKQYPLDRSARQAREERPRKEFDKTHRVRFHLNIPSGLAARKETERTAAMVRLHAHLRRHFKMHGANNIGFHKARNDKTGRFANLRGSPAPRRAAVPAALRPRRAAGTARRGSGTAAAEVPGR